MKKLLLITFILVLIALVGGGIYFNQQKKVADNIIMKELKSKNWDKNIKETSLSHNFKLGRVEKKVIFKDEPKNEYFYFVSPSPSIFGDNIDVKVYGETNIEKDKKSYKYFISD